jgi:hypothetical protein
MKIQKKGIMILISLFVINNILPNRIYAQENKTVKKNDWVDKLYGSFVSDKPAETMISEIRSDRRFIRETPGL